MTPKNYVISTSAEDEAHLEKAVKAVQLAGAEVTSSDPESSLIYATIEDEAVQKVREAPQVISVQEEADFESRHG